MWMLLTAAASAAPIDLTVEVVDIAGIPVPTAAVIHEVEGTRHRVHSETGRWSTSVLYRPDGTELVFARGVEVALRVTAPGYIPTQPTITPGKKRKQTTTVTLMPMLEPAPDAPHVEAYAWQAWQAWMATAAAHLVSPGHDSARTERMARAEVARAAENWLAWAREEGVAAERAAQFCLAATDAPPRCRTESRRHHVADPGLPGPGR